MSSRKIYASGGSTRKTFMTSETLEDKFKVKTSENDSTGNFLDSKIEVDGITKSITNPGGDEKLKLKVTIPEELSKVKITNADTTEDFLDGKITVSGSLTKNVTGAPGNEKLNLDVPAFPAESNQVKCSSDDTTKNYLEDKIAVSGDISKTTLNDGGNEQVQLTVNIPAESNQVKCSSDDTTKNYLEDKIAVSGDISKTTLNDGGNEQVQLTVNIPAHISDNTFVYGSQGSFAAGSFINPFGAPYITSGMGIYVKRAAKIKEVCYNLNQFVTNNGTSYITFNVRKIAADGTRTTEITSASGSSLASHQSPNLPNSSGNYRYYYGFGFDGLDLSVAAGDMIFICCSANTATAVSGCAAWMRVIDA